MDNHMETILKLYKESDEIEIEIEDLETKLKDLYEEKKNLFQKIKNKESIHFDIDILPEEIIHCSMLKPRSYKIYKHDFGYYKYYLRYAGIKISISENPCIDQYPSSFSINGINWPDSTKDCDLPFIQIYYENPEDILFEFCVGQGKMRTLPDAIAKAQEIIGSKWDEELAFGIAILYFWAKIYYHGERENYMSLYKMFEHEL